MNMIQYNINNKVEGNHMNHIKKLLVDFNKDLHNIKRRKFRLL